MQKTSLVGRRHFAMLLVATLVAGVAAVSRAPLYYLTGGRPFGLELAVRWGDNQSICRYTAVGYHMNEELLFTASEYAQPSSVSALLQGGADPNKPAANGTALFAAALSGSEATVDRLVAGGAKLNQPEIPGECRGSVALTNAIEAGNEQMALHLLRLGADPDSMLLGRDAETMARSQGMHALVQLLETEKSAAQKARRQHREGG